MINYPNKKKPYAQSLEEKHNTRHRGISLEDDINSSNQYYLAHNKAVIYKKPTPIQIVKVDYPARNKAKIVEAYYKVPSTTDYNGLYRGKYIDFEAKECKTKRFPFINIHEHQINHLDAVITHGGIAFIIIAFTTVNEVYLIDASYMIDMYRHSSIKHIDYEQVKEYGHLIPQGYIPRLEYLKVVDQVYFKEVK